jgi:hypothetical protein
MDVVVHNNAVAGDFIFIIVLPPSQKDLRPVYRVDPMIADPHAKLLLRRFVSV